jgi:dynein heavy chain
MAMEAQTIKIECENDLSKALPLVKKAKQALDTIQPEHINEVKKLLKPPEAIRNVLHAVCVMC